MSALACLATGTPPFTSPGAGATLATVTHLLTHVVAARQSLAARLKVDTGGEP